MFMCSQTNRGVHEGTSIQNPFFFDRWKNKALGLRCDCCWIHLDTLHYCIIIPGLVCILIYLSITQRAESWKSNTLYTKTHWILKRKVNFKPTGSQKEPLHLWFICLTVFCLQLLSNNGILCKEENQVLLQQASKSLQDILSFFFSVIPPKLQRHLLHFRNP